MRNKILIPLIGAASILLGGISLHAQSAYYQAVTNLAPVAYWPLQETVQPPIADVETNYGSLGQVANAYYSSSYALHANTQGPIVSEPSDFVTYFNSVSNGGFMGVPLTDPRVSLPVAPFSVEAWVFPQNVGGFIGIVSQSSANPGSLNGITSSSGNAAQGGWCLSENYIGSLDTSNLRGFDFHVYNGHSGNPLNASGQPRGGAEVAVPIDYTLNTWYHLVAVFDGTNATLYIDGTNMNSAAAFLAPMPAGTSYMRDTWSPLQIGASRGINNNRYNGSIAEVAIYTNALTATQVTNHYLTALNASPATPYEQVITNDHALMYYRVNAPNYNAPAQTSYPTASYYSANGTTMSVASGNLGANSVYGTATQPGVSGPQFPGLLDPSAGNSSYAVAINGIGGNNGNVANVNIGNNVNVAEAIPVDAGYNALLDPKAPPFSMTVWFKGNPADPRFQAIVGHSDNGWRFALDGTTGKVHFKPGNNGTEITSTYIYNDGNWHQLVATCGLPGTNENLYVDGVLDTANAASATTFTGSPQDIILGGDPQYLNSGNGPYASVPNTTSTYAQRNLAGRIAHFAFFTNVLTAAQVASLYQPVQAPPVIIGQPAGPRTNGYAYNGTNTYLFFGVVASGSAPLSYQWFFTNSNGTTTQLTDGTKYSNSATFQVTVSNLVDSDSGTYFVVVSNTYGAVTSAITGGPGLFRVYNEPVILSQTPAGGTLSLVAGQTPPTFSAGVTGSTNDLVYQWFTNGVAVAGATNTSLPLPPVTVANSGTILQLFVTNDFGVTSNASVTLNVSAGPTAPTNSYAQAILALNPSGYWPMHEIEPPKPAQQDIETNYGSLGVLGNAYYGDWQNVAVPGVAPVILHQEPGALANDPDPSVQFTGVNPAPSGGSYAVIPRTSPLTTIKAPFTLEAWVKPYNNSFGIILGVGSITASSGINGGANEAGFDWLWAGTASTFSITMRNGNAVGSTEPKTTANYHPGNWYHLVTTFDGTNVAYYINGTQDGLQNSSAATMAPNTWMPLTIGGGRWTGTINNQFVGAIDELAVYTNILQVSDIQTHYTDGISGAAGTYKAAVLANKPLLYYRMNSPYYTQPAVSAWPVLTNYGTAGVQGVYKPNATPGLVSGPAVGGFPSVALAGDGNSIFADAGYDASFNPTNTTTAPFSVMAWFKCNPADVQQRNWQTLLGHTDQGWRCAINGGTGKIGFDSGNGKDVASALTYNDGLWHQVIGTYDGASNTTVYVDGQFSATLAAATNNLIQTGYDVYLASSPNGQSNAFGGRTFAGNMCEAAIWNNQALTAAQVATLYNAAALIPFITLQPVSTNANAGIAFTNFFVTAGGSTPLFYQWYKNGALLAGQTNADLVINPLLATSGGTNYYVVVTNAGGSVTSSPASLFVFTSPTISAQVPSDSSITVIAGGNINFSITADGAVPLLYQWYSNSVPIVGATNATYLLANAQTPGPTVYQAVVTNFLGSATNNAVSVTVIHVTAPYAQTVIADHPLGFWRLGECPDDGGGNNGKIAKDYASGNDGYYTNAQICQLPGYNPNTDASEPTALFGQIALADSDVAISNIDFSAPTNSAKAFSVEAWVNGYTESTGGPVISKGFGGGGEEFCLDTGGPNHVYRWFVRLANGAAPNVTSTLAPTSATFGTWHHLVGICDEINNVLQLYIDGASVGTTALPAGSGIISSTVPMFIGARSSSSTIGHNDIQFLGEICQVSVYNYALSAAQVLTHYNSAGITPIIIQQPPGSTNVNENGTLAVSVAVSGTPPLSYQWIDASTLHPLLNQTNLTLVLNNYPLSSNGSSYELVATNVYGSTTSSPVSVSVNSGMPVIVQDLPTNLATYAGAPLVLAVGVSGTQPMTYTYYQNGAVIPGASGSSYTISVAYGTNQYYVAVTNSFGGVVSATEAVVGTAGAPPVNFPATGSAGWTLDAQANGPPVFNSGVLTLTDGAGSESRQAWYNTKVDVSRFLAQYTYEDTTGGTGGADGITFCIQSTGTTAEGGGGGSLGVSGITPSLDFAMNVYHGTTPAGPAAGWNLNGGNATPTQTAPLVLDNGSHPINVVLYYDGTTATAWLTDPTAGTTAPVMTLGVNLTNLVGNPAYIGFTGATGGSVSSQEVFNFSFATVTVPTLGAAISGGNIVISWPASTTSLYVLQSASQVNGPWTAVTGGVSAANGQTQYTVPNGGSAMFYRLILPIH